MGNVHWQNLRIWGSNIPHEVIEHTKGSPKLYLSDHSRSSHRISVKCRSQKLDYITHSSALSFHSGPFQLVNNVTVN
jgi:hypothetical protein